MDQIIKHIIKLRKTILILFAVLIVFSVIALKGTTMNYSMADYLPTEANSTQGLDVMNESFEESMPNLSVMINDVTIQEALNYKALISDIEGVSEVLWLDDIVGYSELQTVPTAFMDQAIVENYYKDGAALLSVVIENGMKGLATSDIYTIIGEDNHMTGEALGTASAMSGASSETANAMLILIPILIFMLIIATDSWIEPIFFMTTIGIAILINMGTNIIFGEISFITGTISPILQLAVSMDYAIFLLHSFTEKRKQYEPEEAMYHAMKASMPTVGASALTTIVGFSALIFMQFGIGSDLGINLFKGIALSFISVMVFLPVITLIFYKLVDKTMHRSLLPHPKRLSGFLMKIKVPLLIIAIILVIPSFLGQSQMNFMYGDEPEGEGSRSYRDQQIIDDSFGNQQVLALIIPQEEGVRELALTEELSTIDGVNQVISYANMVGLKVPESYVPDQAVSQFYGNSYSRVLLYTDLESESERSFLAVEEILNTTESYYSDYYLVGQSPSLNDMRKVVDIDVKRVNIIAVVGILLVLILTFKSLSIPLVLVFTIESAIWMNLAVPYFQGLSINFIGYLVISTIQLGATVDYAILLTHRYLEAREEMSAKEAMLHAITNNISAVLVSATILASAGFVLAATSSQAMVGEIGILLGRGTVLSFLMVVGVLPALLVLLDRFIQKTTIGQKFHSKEDL